MGEYDVTKLEFLLTLNDNIIVQRFFNVRGYNAKARKSLELHEEVKRICDMLENDLKMRSIVYLSENYHQVIINPDILDTSNTDDDEYFYVIIRIGDESICQRVFDAKLYPPKVRYTVDVRPRLKNILRNLTDIFSGENFSTQYLEYTLD